MRKEESDFWSWLSAVDKIIGTKCGVCSDDLGNLPGYSPEDWFAAGLTPKTAAEIVATLLRQPGLYQG